MISVMKPGCNCRCVRLFFLAFLLCAFGFARGQADTEKIALIPYPAKLEKGEGSFAVSAQSTINIQKGSIFKNEALLLARLFKNSFGKSLPVITTGANHGIKLIYDTSVTAAEGYRIVISKQGLKLYAQSPAGMFMAVQTIRQLLPSTAEGKIMPLTKTLFFPVLMIEDQPLYSWRGIHLDVSRHFFSIDYLRKMIDLMALYKLNKFHLHLTDDQGWRVEIKKYPKLTNEGGWRTFNKQDSVCMERSKNNPDFSIDPKHIMHKDGKMFYGGFYTKQQLKELVAYAAARHIDIIPEVDMPGHMMAAISSYSYLSCDGTNKFGELFSTPVCPCLPTTIQFAKDIFTEIMDIFPSAYIHIGGDEVDRSYWEKSDACIELMKKENLKSSAELQTWFIREMETFFNSKGRKLIGWDEILEGGVTKTAAIMYWRTWAPDAPVIAAKNGNKVIMTPGNPLYFSEQPDKNSLPAVYKYNLIPAGLSEGEAKNILGAQGNLWSEYIPTEQRADYLYMPRVTALSEILWTQHRDYDSYLSRLKDHYKRLDILKVSYRLPDLPLLDNYAFTDSLNLSVPAPADGLTIRYTNDNTAPSGNSEKINGVLYISQSQRIRLAAFKDNGRRGDVYDVEFKKQELAGAEEVPKMGNGLSCLWYKKAFNSTALISGVPDNKFIVENIIVPSEAQTSAFTLQYRGYISVPEDAVYTFYLTSDDASVLKIAGREVVNNDGMHAPREKNGQVALAKGAHSIALDFIEGGGGYTLKLQYSMNGSIPKDIPADWLKNL